MKFTAIVVAAGSGSRMCGQNKITAKIGGVPVILRSVIPFLNAAEINEIIVVCRDSELEIIRDILSGFSAESKPIRFVLGGETRQESVSNGVNAAKDADYVIIHDGARPFVSPESIIAVCKDAVEYGAAALAVPLKDTVKEIDERGFVVSTPLRERLMSVQTPQVFAAGLYMKALKKAEEQNRSFTDDCQLIENLGERVFLTTGDYSNIKITTPGDFELAEFLLSGGGKA